MEQDVPDDDSPPVVQDVNVIMEDDLIKCTLTLDSGEISFSMNPEMTEKMVSLLFSAAEQKPERKRRKKRESSSNKKASPPVAVAVCSARSQELPKTKPFISNEMEAGPSSANIPADLPESTQPLRKDMKLWLRRNGDGYLARIQTTVDDMMPPSLSPQAPSGDTEAAFVNGETPILNKTEAQSIDHEPHSQVHEEKSTSAKKKTSKQPPTENGKETHLRRSDRAKKRSRKLDGFEVESDKQENRKRTASSSSAKLIKAKEEPQESPMKVATRISGILCTKETPIRLSQDRKSVMKREPSDDQPPVLEPAYDEPPKFETETPLADITDYILPRRTRARRSETVVLFQVKEEVKTPSVEEEPSIPPPTDPKIDIAHEPSSDDSPPTLVNEVRLNSSLAAISVNGFVTRTTRSSTANKNAKPTPTSNKKGKGKISKRVPPKRTSVSSVKTAATTTPCVRDKSQTVIPSDTNTATTRRRSRAESGTVPEFDMSTLPEGFGPRRSKRAKQFCSPPPVPVKKPKKKPATKKSKPEKFMLDGIATELPDVIPLEKPFEDGYCPNNKEIKLLNDYCTDIPHKTSLVECVIPSDDEDDIEVFGKKAAQSKNKKKGKASRDKKPKTHIKTEHVFPYSIHFPIKYEPACPFEPKFYDRFIDKAVLKYKKPSQFPDPKMKLPRTKFQLTLKGEKHPFVFLQSGVAVRLGQSGYHNPKYWCGDMPKERNPFNFRLGDIVWAPWTTKGKKEFWAAYIFNFQLLESDADEQLAKLDDCASLVYQGQDKIIVAWMNDLNDFYYNIVPYKDVRPFDKSFSYRFEPKCKTDKYFKNVTQAIVAMGTTGYWEKYVNSKVITYLGKMPQAKPLLDSMGSEQINKIVASSRIRQTNTKKKSQEQARHRILQDKVLYRCFEMAYEANYGVLPNMFDNVLYEATGIYQPPEDFEEEKTSEIDPAYRPPLFTETGYDLENITEESAPEWFLHEIPVPPSSPNEPIASRPWNWTVENEPNVIEEPFEVIDGDTYSKLAEAHAHETMVPTNCDDGEASVSLADWMLFQHINARNEQILKASWPPTTRGLGKLKELTFKPVWNK